METSRCNSWAEVVHSKLTCILINMLYEVPDGPTKATSSTPSFLVDQLDLMGGIEFIFIEVCNLLCNENWTLDTLSVNILANGSAKKS